MAPIRTSSLIAKENTKKDPTIEKLDVLNAKMDILLEMMNTLVNKKPLPPIYDPPSIGGKEPTPRGKH
jgi:hypothetical protein